MTVFEVKQLFFFFCWLLKQWLRKLSLQLVSQSVYISAYVIALNERSLTHALDRYLSHSVELLCNRDVSPCLGHLLAVDLSLTTEQVKLSVAHFTVQNVLQGVLRCTKVFNLRANDTIFVDKAHGVDLRFVHFFLAILKNFAVVENWICSLFFGLGHWAVEG